MRIGFVSIWQNRGQAIVTRQIRSIFDEAGCETFILARPTKQGTIRGDFIDKSSDWQEPNVTYGHQNDIEATQYVDWAKSNRLDVVFCDNNAQFEEIAELGRHGVRTIGRFVWERMTKERAQDAKEAFDTVYSLTRAEQKLYRKLGLETPYLRYGIHPDLEKLTVSRRRDAVYFLFHGGLQGRRKPIEKTIEAFKRVENNNIRLIIKSQAVRRVSESVEIDDDPRIQYIVDDLDTAAYHELVSGCHVMLAPSRWEGLGVHLFESLAHGQPVISNDIPPINEVITPECGYLVRSNAIRKVNEIDIFDPDVEDLAYAIELLSDHAKIDELSTGAQRRANELSWDNTRKDYLALVGV